MDVAFKVLEYKPTPLSFCKTKSLFNKGVKTLTKLQPKIDKLLKVWRLRTYTYIAKGVFEHNPLRVQYLRNCVPSLGLYNKEAYLLRPCFFYTCPWCWNRRFCGKVYKKLFNALQNNINLTFYLFEKKEEFSKERFKDAVALIRENQTKGVVLSNKLRRRTCVHGGFNFTYLVPTVEGFKVISKILVASTNTIGGISGYSFCFKSNKPFSMACLFGAYPYAFLNLKLTTKRFCKFLKVIPKSLRRFSSYGVMYRN